jgi:hypothetical protein
MALIGANNTPLMLVGHAGREGTTFLFSGYDAGNSAGVNYGITFVGHVYTEDGKPHTINTSGASSLGWLANAVSLSNAGTIIKVGLAAVDVDNGPPARAVNVGNAITFDVSRTMLGNSGQITANSWQEHAPDAGSKTIANGDLVAFAIQMTASAGGYVNIGAGQTSLWGTTFPPSRPCATLFGTSGFVRIPTYPNCVITFADGSKGFFAGGLVYSIPRTLATWNNASAVKEYGNFIQMPFAAQIAGIEAGSTISGDTDFVLYSDPLGTPVAVRSVSVDGNAVSIAGMTSGRFMFSSPYIAKANEPLAVVIKPGATDSTCYYLTVAHASHQKAHSLGSGAYAINRDTGAFAAQNSGKDRFGIGLLVSAVPHHARPSFSLGI